MSDQVTARDLGLNVASGDEKELFKWFIASFLFGKRIQQDIAVDTYRVIVEKHDRDTPRKLCNCSRQELVGIGPKTVEIFMREAAKRWY